MKTKSKRRSRIFDPNYAPYGRYSDGIKGSPEQWAQSFKARMTPEEIEKIIGQESPWSILGIELGATQEEIKKAYYKKAMETHPDQHPEIDRSVFQKIAAAYEKLRA